MSRVPVKPTLASPPSSASATLTRLPLACELPAADVLRRLAARDPMPFALTGSWAGGGAIVGSDPLRIAEHSEDPFALLDAVPPVDAAAPGAPDGVGGGWFGWLGYRLAARVERIPLHAHRPVALP